MHGYEETTSRQNRSFLEAVLLLATAKAIGSIDLDLLAASLTREPQRVITKTIRATSSRGLPATMPSPRISTRRQTHSRHIATGVEKAGGTLADDVRRSLAEQRDETQSAISISRRPLWIRNADSVGSVQSTSVERPRFQTRRAIQSSLFVFGQECASNTESRSS